MTTSSPTSLRIQVEGLPLNREEIRSIMGVDQHGTSIPTFLEDDPFLASLFRIYRGLVFLTQDPYECLISFMSSGMSTMNRTRGNLAVLRRKLGVPIGETDYCSLPSARTIAGLKEPERELRNMGFGYRAAAIAETCRLLTLERIDLRDQSILEDDDLRKWLMSFPGVGPKIAECVLLFGFGRMEAFPVDVWVMRALQSRWPSRSRRSPEDFSRWAREKWGPQAGLVQQLLFLWARETL
ncbi:MAG: DNA-3-methyladenine glycosylase family protein [Fidelibacterota bacterium]